MDEQTLELQIKSKATEAKASVDSLVKSLTNVENTLTNIYLELGSIEKKGNTKKTTNQIKALNTTTDKATTSATNLGKALSFDGAYLAVKRLSNTMLSWMNEAVDYTEQLNLFNVVFNNIEKDGVKTFSELGKSATQFQYKLNEAFGTNKTQTFYMQGVFQSMGETVGIDEVTSAIMSETMTKLTYDLASLYNKTETTTAEAIRAGVYAGQTKPLRSYGIDVTQNSMQPILESLGITDRSIKQMSQAEKEILRYLATMEQAQIAMGDLANTIESPSNQLKIFRQQLVETKVALSSLFMGLYSNILPYANAFLMVIKEIAKAIATLFGIELTDYNTGIASQEGIYEGIEEEANNATKAVKELKRQTLGFDEIHNINENKDSGSGSAGVSGGIDQRLLDAIKGYDNGMEAVRMKATRIRDSIMEWLGFTIETNQETDEVSFKFSHITGGTVLGGLAVGGIIFNGVKSIYKLLKSIGLLKFTGVTKIFGKLFGLGSSASAGTNTAKKVAETVKPFTVPSVKTILKGMADLTLIIGGAVLLVTAIGGFSKIPGIKEAQTEGMESLKNIFKGLGSIALPLVGLSTMIGVMGSIGVSTFVTGLLGFATVIGGVMTTVTAIGGLLSIPYAQIFLSTGIESVKQIAQGLWDVAIPIGGMTAYLLLLGLATPIPILSGLAGFATVLGGLSLVLAALGALKQIDGFDWIIGEGSEMLNKLGTSMGEFAGSIVSGFVGKSFEGIEKIGTHLSNFIKNAEPFFTGITKIDSSVIGSVKNLASCVLTLTASDILEGLFSWATGESSLENFGKDLSTFAPHFVEYASLIKDINGDVVENSASAAKSLAEFACLIPNQGGFVSLFTGDNKLSDFAEMLPEFGKNFKKYHDNIKGIDNSVITNSTSVAQSLTEFAKEIPNQGGLVSFFTGDNKLSTFGVELSAFGKSFKEYYDSIKGIDGVIVENSAAVAQSITEFANEVPKQGGIGSLFKGDNKLSTFGTELSAFGKKFKEYYDKVKDIDITTIKNINEAITTLIDNFLTYKSNGLSDTILEFGNSIKTYSGQLSSFYSTTLNSTTGNQIGTAFGTAIGVAIAKSIKNTKMPQISLSSATGSVVSTYTIKAYANGGFPEDGLFLANHNELVGQFNNGKTAVANNDQIVDGIKAGVYEAVVTAMSQFNSGGVAEINVHADKGIIVETAVNGIEQHVKQTGTLPFTVPTQ